MSEALHTAVSCEKYIGANFHVTITDTRILEGILTAIDPFGNLLLSNVYETSKDKFDKTKQEEMILLSLLPPFFFF